MSEPDPTPYGVTTVPRDLAELRLRAEAFARAEDDRGLLPLVDDLRRADIGMWPHLWAPAAALAHGRTGDPAAGWALLDEAVTRGFTQVELFEGRLEEVFGDDDRWTALAARMADVPADLELVEWPDPPPHHPVELDRLDPEREAVLRARVPDAVADPSSGAWSTARAVLTWVRRSWEHANDHVEDPDAVDVLDRVVAGERFACVEYSIVLSQALNAVGIPARRLQLLQRPHHVGVGRGHVVSEAWVDDLAAWVLLDGQNGGYWVDESDTPLGLPELMRRHAEGRPARLVGLVNEHGEVAQAAWWRHFATALPTGAGVSPGSFAASFQGLSVARAARLHHDAAPAYPDLDGVGVGLGGDLDRPRLVLDSPHPHATGFRVSGDDWVDEVDVDEGWAVRRDALGDHEARVAVTTRLGAGREHRLAWRVGAQPS